MKKVESQLLHANAHPRTLILVVKFMFTMWFFRYLFDPITQLSELPIEYSSPVSFLGWLPLPIYIGLHSFSGLFLLKLVLLTSCISTWYSKYRRGSAFIACTSIALVNGVTRGFGHINHAEVAPLIVTGLLTLFLYRLSKYQVQFPSLQPCKTSSTALVLATLVFALTYSFVGTARIVHGGIGLLGGETITNSMIRMSHHDWLLEYNYSQWMVASPMMLLMLKLGTAVVTIFELAAPFCLVSDRFRQAWLMLMPAFHLGAILVFKIDFIENMLTMILFLNLTGWLSGQRLIDKARFGPIASDGALPSIG